MEVIQIDVSELALFNLEISNSIGLSVRKLLKKWSRPFNSQIGNNNKKLNLYLKICV
jgi:hypothetical protein